MQLGRIFDRNQIPSLRASIPEFRDRAGSIIEQTLAKRRISPRLGDDSCAIARANLVFISIDDRIERRRIDKPLFLKDRLKRLNPQSSPSRHGNMIPTHRFFLPPLSARLSSPAIASRNRSAAKSKDPDL